MKTESDSGSSGQGGLGDGLDLGVKLDAIGDGNAAGLERLVPDHPEVAAQQGTYFERLEMFGLTAHGGSLNFGIILHGSRTKLDELRRTDEFEAFAFRLNSFFDGLMVVPGLSWEGIQKVMARMSAMQR